MCASDRNQERGFTLIELLLGLGLAAVLLAMLGAMLTSAQRIQARTQAQMGVQRTGYVALDRLSRQIALAGLNLDPSAGEEAFPALPPEAGTDWSSALAIQYRTEDGALQRFAYYLHDGQIMELGGDADPIPVTDDGCRASLLTYTYYTEYGLTVDPARLSDPYWRAKVQRVELELTVDRGNDSPVSAAYGLAAAVTVQNPHR